MKKGSEEFESKLILFSILKFDHNFKTLPVYHGNCLWLSVLYTTKSKIMFIAG